MPETLLGVGLYSLSESARLVHVNPKTLRRWAEGYPFVINGAINGATYISTPILRRDLPEIDGEPILTFNDLLELYMVKLFRDAGVSLQTIRAAAEKAAAMYHTSHPFAIKQFETDGRAIFATLQEHGVEGVPRPMLLQDLNLSQMVMDSIARPFFKKIEYEDFEPLRYWPNGRNGHISSWTRNVRLESRSMPAQVSPPRCCMRWREEARQSRALRNGMALMSRPSKRRSHLNTLSKPRDLLLRQQHLSQTGSHPQGPGCECTASQRRLSRRRC